MLEKREISTWARAGSSVYSSVRLRKRIEDASAITIASDAQDATPGVQHRLTLCTEDSSATGDASRMLYPSSSFVRSLDLSHELEGHYSGVNALYWSPDGHFLASGSEDLRITIWDSHRAYRKATVINLAHLSNIFSVKFMPDSNNSVLISASAASAIRAFDIEYSDSATTMMDYFSARAELYGHDNKVRRLAVENRHCFFFLQR